MEGYKVRMIEEASELRERLHKLSDKIDKFENDMTFDPVELALMKTQFDHMNAYYGTLLLRCEFCFSMEEFDLLKEAIDKEVK
jgi:hypothetical protein